MQVKCHSAKSTSYFKRLLFKPLKFLLTQQIHNHFYKDCIFSKKIVNKEKNLNDNCHFELTYKNSYLRLWSEHLNLVHTTRS